MPDDDLIKSAILQIKQAKGRIMRFEASIPESIHYLLRITNDVNTQGAPNRKLLQGHLENIVAFTKYMQGVTGNLKREWWQNDTLGRLVGLAYCHLLLGDKLITHREACKILYPGKAIEQKHLVALQALLFPRYGGNPSLTAYYDPLEREIGKSARIDRDEARLLRAKWDQEKEIGLYRLEE